MTLIGRNTVFLLLLLLVHQAYSQHNVLDRKIDIRFEDQSVREALKKLMKEGDCFITYQPSAVPQGRQVTRSFKNTSINTIIQEVWGGKLKLRSRGNEITIRIDSGESEVPTKGNFFGRITDEKSEPLPGVTIRLVGTPYGAVTGVDGSYTLKNIPVGTYPLEVSSVGFEKIARRVILNKNNLQINFTLKASTNELEEIVVFGKTEAQIISEEPITINSLDVKQFQNQAIGTEEVLKTTPGLVIRQSGGLGSGMSVNLNGLTGNAVRIYYDGIPLEVYGNGLPVNTIPVDALERVDVYKGVMPIDVGTDALGGGLNLVPVQQSNEYLRTSYSFGSFNTHRFTFNGLKKLSDKVSLSTISYFNYSDNDFRMRDIPSLIKIELPDGSEGISAERIDARRFHDRHISGYVEGKLRFKELKWADQLEFALTYSRIQQQIQNVGRIANNAIGEAENENEVFTQRIDYRKTFLKDRLAARYFGVFSHAVDNINDSTTNTYNWRGEILDVDNVTGAEILERPTLLERKNRGTAHRLILNYKVTDQIDVKASDHYQHNRITGEDPLMEPILVDNELIDPNTLPSTFSRNIFGAAFNAKLFEGKLNAIAFVKNYFYQAKAIDPIRVRDSEYEVIEVRNNRNGYGFAFKYEPHPTFFIRTSLEQAIRIPTGIELLGDLATTIPNFALQPEESLNWNVGAQFEKRFQHERSILININGFIRNRENLIRPLLVSFDRIQFINEAEVDGKGIEATLKISPLKDLSLKGNFTAQSNEIASGSIDIGRQVPNIPLTFYNVGATYRIVDLFKPGNNLQISWTYLFIDKFSINTVPDLKTANRDAFVPEQQVHNAGLTYLLKEKGLAFSFNLQNVFNAQIFDNFRIPRPGVNYSFKINYSL